MKKLIVCFFCFFPLISYAYNSIVDMPPILDIGSKNKKEKKSRDIFDDISSCEDAEKKDTLNKLENKKKEFCLFFLDMKNKTKMDDFEIESEMREMGFKTGVSSSSYDAYWRKLERCQKLEKEGLLQNVPSEYKNICIKRIDEHKKEVREQKIRDIRKAILWVLLSISSILFLWFLWFLLFKAIKVIKKLLFKAITKLFYILRKAWIQAGKDLNEDVNK